MSTTAGFLGSLALTLCGLGLVFWSGVRARMRVHLPAVACTVALLGLTIWFAERLGHEYDLESAGAIKPVHLALAKLATAAYLLPLTTGVLTWRNRRWRALHLVAACTTLLLTVAAAATGTWMVLAAEPLVSTGAAAPPMAGRAASRWPGSAPAPPGTTSVARAP